MLIRLDAGVEVDLATRQDVMSTADKLEDLLGWQRSARWMRLPETLQGTAKNSSLQIGETTGQVLGPRSGYAWAFRRLVVNGMTGAPSPDYVNLYKGASGQPLWQFNGENFGYVFDALQLTLMPGETLALTSVGTFTSTAQIVLSGELVEVPAELLGRLA